MKNSNIIYWLLLLVIPAIFTYIGASNRLDGQNGVWPYAVSLVSFIIGAFLLARVKMKKAGS